MVRGSEDETGMVRRGAQMRDVHVRSLAVKAPANEYFASITRRDTRARGVGGDGENGLALSDGDARRML
jgi:hypothetical protein